MMVFMELLHVPLQDTHDMTDFRTLLLDEILNFAWFSHRQALNRNRGPMLQNWWEMKEVQIKLLT